MMVSLLSKKQNIESESIVLANFVKDFFMDYY